jgi:predicted DNA-binding transcriptional regulator AlpA
MTGPATGPAKRGDAPPSMSASSAVEWLAAAPDGTLVSAATAAEWLGEALGRPDGPRSLQETAGPLQENPAPLPWRVLLWSCPPDTRLGVDELLEAVGRPRSWLYKKTMSGVPDRIPHRKLDGALVFVAGEVRHWLKEREELVSVGLSDADVVPLLRRR